MSCRKKRYPLKATISTLKSGKGLAGAIFGSKEQCVVITIDREAQIAISNTTVGTYLYVEIYLMVQRRLISFAAISDAIGMYLKRNIEMLFITQRSKLLSQHLLN